MAKKTFDNSINKEEVTMCKDCGCYKDSCRPDSPAAVLRDNLPAPTQDADLPSDEILHRFVSELRRLQDGYLTTEERYRNDYIAQVTPKDGLGEIDDLVFHINRNGEIVGTRFISHNAFGVFAINTTTGVIMGPDNRTEDILDKALCTNITCALCRAFPPKMPWKL